MPRLLDITGHRFNRWLVLSRASSNKPGAYWECRCDCGTIRIVRSDTLIRGLAKSCGCFNKERRNRITHGLSAHRIYKVWDAMRQRCSNPKASYYKHYGGRGIRVCERWQQSFRAFIADMGMPEPGLTIDRIDVNGNYEPGNCRWATRAQQMGNRRAATRQCL